MKYICSATIKQFDESNDTAWMPSLARWLTLSEQQAQQLSLVTPYREEGHIPASRFFRTAFAGLHNLRNSQNLQIPLENGYQIEDISTRFTRYENTVFLFFLIDVPNAPQSEEELNAQQDELLVQLIDKFGEYLNFDFHVTAKVEQFKELFRYQPLTAVFEQGEQASENLLNKFRNTHQGTSYTRNYKNRYATKIARQNTGASKTNYIREQCSILHLNVPLESLADGDEADKSRSQFYNVIQTETAFFSRTRALENNLQETYERIDFLSELVGTMQDQWVKIRSLFTISPKFALLNRSNTSHLFFNLLEVNAQVNALQGKIETRLDNEFGPMQERYERLHFNLESAHDEERNYFEEIHKLVLKSFEAYTKRMDVVSNSIERLNKGISQLREDFDSNTNVMVQMLMFLFSLVMVVWGLFVFLADKSVAIEAISSNIPILASGGVGALLAILLLYFFVIRMLYMSKASKSEEHTIHNGIERCLINCPKTVEKINAIVNRYVASDVTENNLTPWQRFKLRNNNPAKHSLLYLYQIKNTLDAFSTLLPSVALEKYPNKEALQAVRKLSLKLQLAYNQKRKIKELVHSAYGNNVKVYLYDSRTNSTPRVNDAELLIVGSDNDNTETRKDLENAVSQALRSKKIAIKYSDQNAELNSVQL